MFTHTLIWEIFFPKTLICNFYIFLKGQQTTCIPCVKSQWQWEEHRKIGLLIFRNDFKNNDQCKWKNISLFLGSWLVLICWKRVQEDFLVFKEHWTSCNHYMYQLIYLQCLSMYADLSLPSALLNRCTWMHQWLTLNWTAVCWRVWKLLFCVKVVDASIGNFSIIIILM